MASGWNLKPRLGRNRRKAPRLGSLESWRSDLILESSSRKEQPLAAKHHTPSNPQSKPSLSVSVPALDTELSVIGLKPTASSPVFSQLPGANLTKVSRGSPAKHRGAVASPIPSPPSLSRVSSIADGLSMYRIAPVSSPQDVAPSLSVSAPVKMDNNRSGGNSWERCAAFNTASAPLKIEQLQPSAREQLQPSAREQLQPSARGSTSPSAPVPSSAPELAPAPDPEKPKLLEAPTLSRDALEGKLMEVDALLRHKFATRQELESVQQAVDTGLSLLSELPALAAQAHLIEGALFQELLQRLANAPPMQQSSAQPAHPVPPLPGGLVSRTPIPGAERETWKASQSIQGLYGGDQTQLMLLLDRVGALRSLLRIKIEDNRDLDLARRALGDVQCAIENLWWYASEMGASEDDSVDPEDKLGVTTLLQELRGEA